MTETIRRAPHGKDNPYFLMSRSAAQNKDMSLDALGMLAYLLSKPGDWKIQPEDLQRKDCGRNKVYNILNELIRCGHVERVVTRDQNNRHVSTEYLVFEVAEPLPDFQDPAFQDPENGDYTEYRALQSTEKEPRNFPEENLLGSEEVLDAETHPSFDSAKGKRRGQVVTREDLERQRFEAARKTRQANNAAPSFVRGAEKSSFVITSPDLPSICQAIYRIWKNDKLKITANQIDELRNPITIRDGTGYPSLETLYVNNGDLFETWMTTVHSRMAKNNISPTAGNIIKQLRGIDWRGGWLTYNGVITAPTTDHHGQENTGFKDLSDLL